MSQLSFGDLFGAVDCEPDVSISVAANVPAEVKLPRAMITSEEARKQFIRVFSHTGRHLRRWDVFCDFITLAASELDMATIRTPENIERSRKICDRYEADDLDNLKTLFCLLVAALEGKFQDFLGSVFMELELGSGDMGQYFTPYELQSMMAKMLMHDVTETIKTQGWVTLSEPCCGAAGMVIAYAECLLEAGLNPSEQLLVHCIDIDPVAADMAFIQLGLLGIPAEVVTGNTLTMQFNRVRYTPVYYINEWQARIDLRQKFEAMKAAISRLVA
ncbi:N-6 DNA methylase [Acerihabitans sp. TG2]|uniref:N-6 DNA methylase n=1 Tax=Acerihabitans sp. TG2 TaxID=3096008 RepID=UPI002B2263E3|nr:N-6 DNA methylase [Acerihabitans sp. TG2]MEA9392679.1 N-6 DNA methylase [Acerihabitans sp. TG2]